MLFVPSPRDTHRHLGSVGFIASSVRHTPPPAVPTHSRQAPRSWQRGEIASVDTRPETVFCSDVPGFSRLVSGPSDVQTLSPGVRPRYATPRKAQYFCVDA